MILGLPNWDVFSSNHQIKWSDIDVGVTIGVNGNNAATLGDGKTNYDGSNNNLRWTSWDEASNGKEKRGELVVLELSFNNQVYSLREVDFFHFIDAGGCDFPEEITIYYLNSNDEYVKIENIYITKNYENERRRACDNVYVMDINGVSTTFVWSYKGTCPISYYKFPSSVLAKGLKIEVKAKENWYTGFTEIKFVQ
jgi:hypothetical protein